MVMGRAFTESAGYLVQIVQAIEVGRDTQNAFGKQKDGKP
jgi:hypothetical protein